MDSNWNISHSVQNEEVLKKCAQEYLSRVRKEEQRYQALKIHAEEKLDKWVNTYSHYAMFIISWLYSFHPKGKQHNALPTQLQWNVSGYMPM